MGMASTTSEFEFRNALLVFLFSLCVPYLWLEGVALLASWFPLYPLIEIVLHPQPQQMVTVLMLESTGYSLLVCLPLGLVFGALINRQPLENALYFSLFSSIHLGLAIYLQHLPRSSMNWNFVAAEIGGYFVWCWMASLAGYVWRRRRWRQREREARTQSLYEQG